MKNCVAYQVKGNLNDRIMDKDILIIDLDENENLKEADLVLCDTGALLKVCEVFICDNKPFLIDLKTRKVIEDDYGILGRVCELRRSFTDKKLDYIVC